MPRAGEIVFPREEHIKFIIQYQTISPKTYIQITSYGLSRLYLAIYMYVHVLCLHIQIQMHTQMYIYKHRHSHKYFESVLEKEKASHDNCWYHWDSWYCLYERFHFSAGELVQSAKYEDPCLIPRAHREKAKAGIHM